VSISKSTNAIPVAVITGPTASGKTALALDVAEALDAVIISCDSRQIYRSMDIGTAKPSAAELQRVKHYLVDICHPDEQFSAYDFGQKAFQIIQQCYNQRKPVLVVGGSGYYLNSLFFQPTQTASADSGFRNDFRKKLERVGNHCIFEELQGIDPDYAEKIHPNDTYRIMRALEVFHQTGKPVSQIRQVIRTDLSFRIFTLVPNRDRLYQRINKRVDEMIAQGLYDEFRSLVAQGYSEHTPGLQTVGYREFFPTLTRQQTQQQAIEIIKQHTRQFAKRQFTWFNNKLTLPQTLQQHFECSWVINACKEFFK